MILYDFTLVQLRYALNVLTTPSWRMVVSRYALLFTVDLSAVPSTSGITGDFVSFPHFRKMLYFSYNQGHFMERGGGKKIMLLGKAALGWVPDGDFPHSATPEKSFYVLDQRC